MAPLGKSRLLRAALPAMLVGGGGCFPTFQAARIHPGLRVDAELTVLVDQRRDNAPQGPDIVVTITPAYGFGRRFEVGLPIGSYGEEWPLTPPTSGDNRFFFISPYAKLALLDTGSRHHLSISAQSVFTVPGNLGIHYGVDLGAWEPQLSASWIHSGGPGDEDEIVERYQQADQSLFALSFRATLNRSRRPAVGVGVLRNQYAENRGAQPSVPRTLYDLFVVLNIGLRR